MQSRILWSLKIFWDQGKGTVRDHSSQLSSRNRPRPTQFRETRVHFSIHRSEWHVRPWSSSRCATHISAKHTHTCARARICERTSTGQCVHSRYRLTHARACSTRRSTTLAALSPRHRPAATLSPLQLADQPVLLLLTSPARLSTVLHVVPTRTICFIAVTWSPPFCPLLSAPIWRHAVTNHIMFAALTLARRKDYF